MHILPDVVQTFLAPKEIRAAEIALSRFTTPTNALEPDVKGFATAIQDAGASLKVKIKRNVALNAAAHILVGKPWQQVQKSLSRPEERLSISLHVLGGDHEPQTFPIASIGKIADAAIEHILQQTSASRGAVADIQRSPYGVTLTITDRDRPTFVIECYGPFRPSDHVRLTYRLVDVLGERAPTLLVNNGLLPMDPKRKPYTQAFFQLKATEGSYRAGRLVSELDLFEQFDLLRVRGHGGDKSDTVMSAIGAVQLQVGFRPFNEPWPRDHAPVTAPQLATLISRYARWSDAVGSDVGEAIKVLKQRRRSIPLAASHLAREPGQASISVLVPALLPMTMALGADFFNAVIDRNRLADLSSVVRGATLTQVPEHVAGIKARLEAERPGVLEWLDKNQHAAAWPMPRQMMGISMVGGSAGTEIAGLGYWQHAEEVAGPTGRYTSLEYSVRLADVDLTNALKRAAIKTSIPCPVCSQPAPIAVTMVPTNNSLGVWSLDCDSCGHNEAVVDAPDRWLAVNAAAVSCSCKRCVERGTQLLDTFGPVCKDFPRLLDNALVNAVKHLTSQAPGWTLAPDKTAHFGKDLSGQYIELPVAAVGDTAQNSLYRSLPDRVREQLRNGGAVSALLARDHGFERDLSYCAMSHFDGSAGWEQTYSLARAGFDSQDAQSFRSWAQSTVAFALGGMLVLPMLVTVREPSRLADAAA